MSAKPTCNYFGGLAHADPDRSCKMSDHRVSWCLVLVPFPRPLCNASSKTKETTSLLRMVVLDEQPGNSNTHADSHAQHRGGKPILGSRTGVRGNVGRRGHGGGRNRGLGLSSDRGRGRGQPAAIAGRACGFGGGGGGRRSGDVIVDHPGRSRRSTDNGCNGC